MDQDYAKLGVTESALIKKFEGDELVDITKTTTDHPSKEELEKVLADSLPGYNRQYALGILMGLQRKPIYGGTVSSKTKEKRRARNAQAKRSRRANRP